MRICVQELLTEALAAEWTAEQAAVLEQTEGAESVVDAVQRVAAKVPQVGRHDIVAAILCLQRSLNVLRHGFSGSAASRQASNISYALHQRM